MVGLIVSIAQVQQRFGFIHQEPIYSEACHWVFNRMVIVKEDDAALFHSWIEELKAFAMWFIEIAINADKPKLTL